MRNTHVLGFTVHQSAATHWDQWVGQCRMCTQQFLQYVIKATMSTLHCNVNKISPHYYCILCLWVRSPKLREKILNFLIFYLYRATLEVDGILFVVLKFVPETSWLHKIFHRPLDSFHLDFPSPNRGSKGKGNHILIVKSFEENKWFWPLKIKRTCFFWQKIIVKRVESEVCGLFWETVASFLESFSSVSKVLSEIPFTSVIGLVPEISVADIFKPGETIYVAKQRGKYVFLQFQWTDPLKSVSHFTLQ